MRARRACILLFCVSAIGAGRAPALPRYAVARSMGSPFGAAITQPADAAVEIPADAFQAPAPARSSSAASVALRTHVIYFVPKDQPNQGLDTDGTLARSVDAMRAWFARELGQGGTPRAPRMDRLSTGAYDITFVRGDQAAAAYGAPPSTVLQDVIAELQRKGFNDANKRYLIYAALNEGNTCGEGQYPLTPGDTGHYATVYLDSDASCGARDFATSGTVAGAGKAETIAAHEWLHAEGVAPLDAPHHCPTSPYHICTGALWLQPSLDPENTDIVFPLIYAPLGKEVLDRGRDDYLDAPWPWISNLRASPWLEAV